MSSSWFSRIQKSLTKRTLPASPRRARLELEALEERRVMSTFMVVPGTPDNVTTFGSLADALTVPSHKAGDVIQIEPGSIPGHIVNSQIPMVQNLTIQGDPAANVQSIPYFFFDDSPAIGAAQQGFTLKNVGVDILGGTLQLLTNCTITGARVKNEFFGIGISVQGTTAAVISNSYFESTNPLAQSTQLVKVSPAAGSFNSITNNQFVVHTGTQVGLLFYNGGAGLNDLVAHNTFVDDTASSTIVEVLGTSGLTLQANTITGAGASETGIEVEPTAQLQIVDNVIALPNTGPGARGIAVLPGLTAGSSNIVIANNHINTGTQGLGLQFYGEGPGFNLAAQVQDNDLRGNRTGVQILAGAGGSVGGIDLGGGAQSSTGGNDFRGDLQAIGVSAATNAGPIWAQQNIFSVADPKTVIFDGFSHPGFAAVISTNPQMERADILGRVGQNGQWWVGTSNGAGFATSLWDAWNPNVTWVDVVTGDFTGTGQTDIAGRVLETGQWWVAVPNGTGFKTTLWGAWSPAVTWVDVKVGDFDGFGRDDIIGRVKQTGQWWVAESNGNSFNNSLWGTWNPNVTWVDVNVGNFTGHGYTDIAARVLETGQWWVGASSDNGFTTSLWTTWSPNVTWVDVKVGDFNGDGLSDIAGRVLQNGQWWVAQSTGSSFTNELWTTWSPNATWVDVQVGDFNGDGKSDIIGRVKENGQWWVGLSTGSSFANSLSATWSTAVTWVDVQVGDFNGDGQADITGRVLENGQWWTGISNGAGLTTQLWCKWSPAVTWTDVHGGDFS